MISQMEVTTRPPGSRPSERAAACLCVCVTLTPISGKSGSGARSSPARPVRAASRLRRLLVFCPCATKCSGLQLLGHCVPPPVADDTKRREKSARRFCGGGPAPAARPPNCRRETRARERDWDSIFIFNYDDFGLSWAQGLCLRAASGMELSEQHASNSMEFV